MLRPSLNCNITVPDETSNLLVTVSQHAQIAGATKQREEMEKITEDTLSSICTCTLVDCRFCKAALAYIGLFVVRSVGKNLSGDMCRFLILF